MNRTNVVHQADAPRNLLPTQGLLQRKCSCGSKTMASGECSECAKKKNGLQRKLSIGASNDPLEHEADRVADQVMAMSPDTNISSTPPRIQRFTGQSTGQVDTAPPSVDRVLASSGSSMELALRQDMEHRFGRDFSNVRIHTGGPAEQSARDVKASAYTVGSNIVFDTGQFLPGTQEGKSLLAHELTHVVQQSTRQTIFSNGKNSENTISNYPGISIATRTSTAEPAIQRKFIGTDKKKVEMEKGEKVKHILITSNNASPALRELIRLVNESGSETEVDQVLKASNNESEIDVKIQSEVINNNLYGLHQAHDKDGNALKWDSDKGDFDGIPAYASDGVYKAATITIFEGNLEKGGGNDASHKSAGIKLTLDQLLAGTFSHETGHNTDEEFIDDLRKRRKGEKNNDIDPHKNIKPLDEKVYGEIGDHARSETVCEWDEELAARRIDALNAGRTFFDKDMKAANKYFTDNAKKEKNLKDGSDEPELGWREGCLKSVHEGAKKYTGSEQLRLGPKEDNTIEKTMGVNEKSRTARGLTLTGQGYVEDMNEVWFKTEKKDVNKEVWRKGKDKKWRLLKGEVLGKDKKVQKIKRDYPTSLDGSIWATVIELSKGDPGWSVYPMSLYDGNHSVTLTLDAKDPSAPKIYWSDQWPSKGGWKEYTSSDELDAEVTKRVQEWWKGKREEEDQRKPKYFRPVVRVWRLRRVSEQRPWLWRLWRLRRLQRQQRLSEQQQQQLLRLEQKANPSSVAKWQIDLTKKPAGLADETETTSPRIPNPDSDAQFELSGRPHLRFSSGEETSAEFALKFEYYIPLLLETKLRPFIFAGVHADTDKKMGASGGIGARSNHFADMSVYLAGNAGLRTPSFNAVEFGGGLEAAWEFDKSRSLRVGVEWQTWLQMGDIDKRTHLLGLLTIGKTFD